MGYIFTANPSPIYPVGCGVSTEANLWFRRRMEGWPCLWALRLNAPPNLGYPTQPGYQCLPVVAPTPCTPLPPQRFGYQNLKDVLDSDDSEDVLDSDDSDDDSWF